MHLYSHAHFIHAGDRLQTWVLLSILDWPGSSFPAIEQLGDENPRRPFGATVSNPVLSVCYRGLHLSLAAIAVGLYTVPDTP